MGRAYVSSVLDVDIDTVWAVLGDFHGLAEWVGRIRDSIAEDGTGRGPVGSVRRLTVDSVGQIRERLVAYDAPAHRYSYEFADTIPFPVRSYRGTVHLLPVTSSGQTFLEWYGEFDCDAAQVEAMQCAFTDIYRGFIDDLKQYLGR